MLTYSSSYRKSKALIVGIDSYLDLSLTTLTNAEKDATAFSSILSSLEIPFTVDLLLGDTATRDEILAKVQDLRKANPDDRLLIYFAGHGEVVIDQVGNETGYLIAFDSDASKEYTCISIPDLLKLRNFSPAKHIGFIFDSCFSGQALGLTRATSSVAMDKYLSRRAYQVITAGAGDQTVLDASSMTKLMVDAFQGDHTNEDGHITFSSLGLFLKEAMASSLDVDQLPQFGHLQGSQGGEYIFSANEAYWSLVPKSVSSAVDIPSTAKKQIIPAGIYQAQVDLSGRIDNETSPTVVSISAGLSYSIILEATEKQRALTLLSVIKPRWGLLRRKLLIYSLLIFHLISDHVEKLDRIEIDNEYPGHDPFIKNMILQLLKASHRKASRQQLQFTKLAKYDLASQMASGVQRGDKEADWVITAEELLSPTQ